MDNALVPLQLRYANFRQNLVGGSARAREQNGQQDDTSRPNDSTRQVTRSGSEIMLVYFLFPSVPTLEVDITLEGEGLRVMAKLS